MMNVIYGPARVVLRLPTNPNTSDVDIEKAIESVPSLQPGLRLHGHNPKTDQWPQVGTIGRVWREGREICQEAMIDPGAEIDMFPPVYVRFDVVSS